MFSQYTLFTAQKHQHHGYQRRSDNGSSLSHDCQLNGIGAKYQSHAGSQEDIDYVNAHGTSTHHNDLFETKAIRLALGDHAEKVKINSTKSMIGHLLGAAGGVEFITCVKSIQDGFVHATVGLEKPGEGCDLDYTMGDGVSMNVDVAISNSLGFGGHNASLIVKKFSE